MLFVQTFFSSNITATDSSLLCQHYATPHKLWSDFVGLQSCYHTRTGQLDKLRTFKVKEGHSTPEVALASLLALDRPKFKTPCAPPCTKGQLCLRTKTKHHEDYRDGTAKPCPQASPSIFLIVSQHFRGGESVSKSLPTLSLTLPREAALSLALTGLQIRLAKAV